MRKTERIDFKEPFEYKNKHHTGITLKSLRAKDLKSMPSELWDAWEKQSEMQEDVKAQLDKDIVNGFVIEEGKYDEILQERLTEATQDSMKPADGIKMAIGMIPLIASMSDNSIDIIEQIGVKDLMEITAKVVPFLVQSLSLEEGTGNI